MPVRRTGLVIMLTLGLAAPAAASSLTRGRHHERLDTFVGDWIMAGKSRGLSRDGKPSMVNMTGNASFGWVLERTWLLMRISETVGDIHPFHHLAMITWDEKKGHYVRRMFTSSSTRDPIEEGRWVGAKTLEFKGAFDWDDGRTYGFRNVFEIRSDTEVAMTLYQTVDGGEEFIRTEAILTKSDDSRRTPVPPDDGDSGDAPPGAPPVMPGSGRTDR